MKPKEIANRIMDAVGKADDLNHEHRYGSIRATLLTLASELCALEPSWGHAERLHKLTGDTQVERPPHRSLWCPCTACVEYWGNKPGEEKNPDE